MRSRGNSGRKTEEGEIELVALKLITNKQQTKMPGTAVVPCRSHTLGGGGALKGRGRGAAQSGGHLGVCAIG